MSKLLLTDKEYTDISNELEHAQNEFLAAEAKLRAAIECKLEVKNEFN